MHMKNRILLRGFAAFATFAFVLTLAMTAAAKGDPHVVQTSTGDLYVVDGSKRYALKVYSISDSDLASLTIIGYATWGRLPVRPARPVGIVLASDGSLYLVQNGGAWPLNPDPISNAELARGGPVRVAGWNNEVGNRVLVLSAFDGTKTEFRPAP
jgi:hypothetical protein